ncbi:hypothetical protein CIRG_08714 [Coccidioides immitis RMSCC 2394]|uniref:Uncharacterized protein n=1 Tax=Coccidioides immitis RMSCC 2394 TaxID=404692 RepID=A0A0J6YQ20_COCIT|nr:hypothetical protein CIRG_08714 [Coccidioides immitis RMSCC 2394]
MPSTDSKPINSNPATKLDEIYRVKTLSDASSEPAEHPLSDLTSSTDLALAYLCTTTKLDELHTSLLHSLSAAGWTERVRSLAFELLRSGRCTRFDELLDKVVHLATSPKPTTGDSPSPSPTSSSSSSSSILGKRKRDKGPNGTTSATNGIPPLKKENTSDAEGSKGEEDHPDETEDSHEQTANGTTTTAETADPKGKHKSPSDDDDDDDDDDNNNSNSKNASKEEKKKKAKKKKKKEKENDDDDDDELYLLAEFDVRIPSHIVGRGVKFLHEAIDEIFTKAPKGQDEDGGAERAPRAAADTHHHDDDDEEVANPKVKIAKKR